MSSFTSNSILATRTFAVAAILVVSAALPAQAAGKSTRAASQPTDTAWDGTWQGCWQRFLDSTSGGKGRRAGWFFNGTCPY